jgi:hypothetical protein
MTSNTPQQKIDSDSKKMNEKIIMAIHQNKNLYYCTDYEQEIYTYIESGQY